MALVRQRYNFFPDSFSLTILCDSVIQMFPRILVHPILVYPKEHIVGSLEVDLLEVSCER